MRMTKLKAADYKLIGEIVVLSGMIEDTLKRMPLAMFNIDYIPGISMTAHLKVSSLCDMVLTIMPYFAGSEILNQEVEAAILLARKSSDLRNNIVHGPFWFPTNVPFKGVRRFTARSKLNLVERAMSTDDLREILAIHIQTWKAVSECFVGMTAVSEGRDHLGLPPLRPDFAQKANHQTPIVPGE